MRNISEITINGKALSEILELNRKANGLWNANLRNANLQDANLQDADLRNANLWNANLRNADLRNADLWNANLRNADLWNADLRNANLQDADLRNADLWNADLRNANLRNAKNIPDYVVATTCILPEGDIIGWKKCADNIIVKMKIPAKAKRSNATGRKCRAEYVKVLQCYDDKHGELPDDYIAYTDQNGPHTKYQKGKNVKCDQWDDNRWNECSGGIHFFLTRYEAKQY